MSDFLLLTMMYDCKYMYKIFIKKYNLDMQLTIINTLIEMIAADNNIKVTELSERMNDS